MKKFLLVFLGMTFFLTLQAQSYGIRYTKTYKVNVDNSSMSKVEDANTAIVFSFSNEIFTVIEKNKFGEAVSWEYNMYNIKWNSDLVSWYFYHEKEKYMANLNQDDYTFSYRKVGTPIAIFFAGGIFLGKSD